MIWLKFMYPKIQKIVRKIQLRVFEDVLIVDWLEKVLEEVVYMLEDVSNKVFHVLIGTRSRIGS